MTEPSQEEILELIWTIDEEKGEVERESLIKKMCLPSSEQILSSLIQEEYVTISDSKVALTKKGLADRKSVV